MKRLTRGNENKKKPGDGTRASSCTCEGCGELTLAS
jgi:hypothetical protein